MAKAFHHLQFKFKHGHLVFTIPTAKPSGVDRIRSKRIDSTSVVPTARTELTGNMVETEITAKMERMDLMVEATDRVEPMGAMDNEVFF